VTEQVGVWWNEETISMCATTNKDGVIMCSCRSVLWRMIFTVSALAVLVALAIGTALRETALAVEVAGTRFDPPRLYLTHASLNKSGTLGALKGQDNFLSLYMPPVDNAKNQTV
jgi:hypothetical protein